MIVLVSCNNQQKIENWDPDLFESIGAPFLKRPAHLTWFEGPYAAGENDDGVYFLFQTERSRYCRKYVKRCIKGIEKYADKIYDISEYPRGNGKLTPEKLQEYAVKKGHIKLKSLRTENNLTICDVIYSKDGQYFEFTASYRYFYIGECQVGVYPCPHLSAL